MNNYPIGMTAGGEFQTQANMYPVQEKSLGFKNLCDRIKKYSNVIQAQSDSMMVQAPQGSEKLLG